VKRRREEEIDVVYDLSSQYPPLAAPSRPTLNVGEIKSLLVAATAAGEEVKPLLDEPNMDPKLRAFGKFSMSLFKVVEALVENGLVPMANGETTATGGAAFSNRSARGPPVPPKAPGVKELRDTLEKAERESILFDADLGPNPLGNRSGLAAALSGGIRNSAILNACDRGADPAEAVRIMDDALGCVNEMDFIGIRSEKSKPRPGSTPEQLQQHAEKNYCTMPIKFKFEDRNTRMHFERTIKNVCNLRAVMSLPKSIRDEQNAFVKALRDRYPGKIITARPDLATLRFVAFYKGDREKRWEKCRESIPIPTGIMLPEYTPRKEIILPPTEVQLCAADNATAVQVEAMDASGLQSF
jgi:hypothetical protein